MRSRFRIAGLPLFLWVLAAMGGRSTPSMANTESHKPPMEPSIEERIRRAKEEGAEEARKDLAAGNPKQYRFSGIVGAQYNYNWDPTFGLRIIDTGCIHSAVQDEYNRVVEAWIAKHGLPPGSRKPRFVSLEMVRKALQSGTSLERGEHFEGPHGNVLRWNKPNKIDSEDVAPLLAESNGRITWSVGIGGTEPIRVAWSGRNSWFVEFAPGQRGEHSPIWHVDADGDGVLQTFDTTPTR